MSEILRSAAQSEVVDAVEANHATFITMRRSWPAAAVHDEADMVWSMTDIPFTVYNAVARARLRPSEVDSVINAIVAMGSERGVPIGWCVGPGTRPGDLGTQLERHGFQPEPPQPAMALDLARVDGAVLPPPGVTITEVGDGHALEVWCRTLGTGFGLPAAADKPNFDMLMAVGLGKDAPMRHYLAWLGGAPVATSSMLYGGGVAGIYDVGTLPEARRRGIGAAMTLTPLIDARRAGYRVAVLEASEMGAPLYRKLGFREVCTLDYYRWPATEGGAR